MRGRDLGAATSDVTAWSARPSPRSTALWDCKARLLGISLARLFGRVRDSVPVYGSGGFTSLTDEELAEQVEGWLAAGCAAVKIKVGEAWGTRPGRDVARTQLVRDIVGADVELMVDANGGSAATTSRDWASSVPR